MTPTPTQIAAEREGPQPFVIVRDDVCNGCKHLQTDYWKDYLEDDETDSGWTATCTARRPTLVIDHYWSSSTPAPEWCPFVTEASHEA